MTYADPARRAALIQGLRALADYLESDPDVPVSSYANIYAFPSDGGCAAMRAAIDSIAERLGTRARETVASQYTAIRSFGPVEYRAVAICKHRHHKSKG
jgi:hypothetical protein